LLQAGRADLDLRRRRPLHRRPSPDPARGPEGDRDRDRNATRRDPLDFSALSSGPMATLEANTELGRQVVADAKEYVLHSWSVQNALQPIPVAGAEGRHFWDFDGNRYLDFASQLVNVSIGHQHPKIVAAIKEQAEKLCTIGPRTAAPRAIPIPAPCAPARRTWRRSSSTRARTPSPP